MPVTGEHAGDAFSQSVTAAPAMEHSTSDRPVSHDRAIGASFSAPLFILAPPRSYTSLVSAMIGQHPQLYGFPELHLLTSDTIGAWWKACERANFSREDGTLRAVAELFYGGQTEETVAQARGWLIRRTHMSTGLLLEMLARRVSPRIPVEKSPSTTYSIAHMRRADRMFPGARYVHLLRHPRTQAESMLGQLEVKRARGARLRDYWLDPPLGWYANHRHIGDFLESIDSGRSIRIRAEDLLQEPDEILGAIARWLGVRDDPEAIEAMKHPERSPFACVGPKGAMFGADRSFLESPQLRPVDVGIASLEDPVDWRDDGTLPLRVKNLARSFGYA